MIGNFVDAVVRHPGDHDACICGGLDVHAIDSDSEAGDDPASLHLADHLGGHLGVGDQ